MIAFLGWGSLVWNPGALPIQRFWHNDGPYIRAEFLRQSSNKRLTLVLSETANPTRSLWATYAGTDRNAACEALREREGISQRNSAMHIGSWTRGQPNPDCILELEPWATAHGINSVVWTALPPKFNGANNTSPTVEEAVTYLSGLEGPERDTAEEYIRRAPQQIDTAYRRRIEAALGWSYLTHN